MTKPHKDLTVSSVSHSFSTPIQLAQLQQRETEPRLLEFECVFNPENQSISTVLQAQSSKVKTADPNPHQLTIKRISISPIE